MCKSEAWIVSVDMGYGHQRAAYPFRDIAFRRIITANTDPCVSTKERALWAKVQAFYEDISRAQRIPIIGPWMWRAYDRFQAISPHYPFRDLSKPSLGSTRLHSLIRRGFGASVVTCARERDGYLHVPNRGTENIKRLLFAPDRSSVELRGVPPTLRDSRSAESGHATCGNQKSTMFLCCRTETLSDCVSAPRNFQIDSCLRRN
jgi:hypothetical protein